MSQLSENIIFWLFDPTWINKSFILISDFWENSGAGKMMIKTYLEMESSAGKADLGSDQTLIILISVSAWSPSAVSWLLSPDSGADTAQPRSGSEPRPPRQHQHRVLIMLFINLPSLSFSTASSFKWMFTTKCKCFVQIWAFGHNCAVQTHVLVYIDC